MAENFLNLKKEPDIHEQEAQRVPDKMNPKRPTARHIIIKMAKFRSNSKGTKRKSHVQGHSHKAISRLF